MKRAHVLFIVLCLLFSLTSCSTGDKTTTKKSTNTNISETTTTRSTVGNIENET